MQCSLSSADWSTRRQRRDRPLHAGASGTDAGSRTLPPPPCHPACAAWEDGTAHHHYQTHPQVTHAHCAHCSSIDTKPWLLYTPPRTIHLCSYPLAAPHVQDLTHAVCCCASCDQAHRSSHGWLVHPGIPSGPPLSFPVELFSRSLPGLLGR